MIVRLLFGIVAGLFVCTFSAGSNAAPASAIVSLSPFSPAKVPLQWKADETLTDATYTIYYRAMDGETPGAWERAASLHALSATQGFFDGESGKKYEFRSAVSSPQGSEMAVLADFDYAENNEKQFTDFENNRIFPACSIEGFNRTFFIRTGSSKQGNGCYHFTFFSHIKDATDIPAGALIGLRFDSKIPVRDWSSYRYLEMYYWGNVPEGMQLWIETRKIGIRKPILQFSEDGNAPEQWHSILVDLDKVLGDPNAREEIQTVSFVKPIRELDLTKTYEIRLDAIRLWQTRRFFPTVIDDTPPSKPENLNYKVNSHSIVWTWDASKDDESDIAGYSFLFTQDRRNPFPQEIKTATNSISIPFAKPPAYQEFHFMVSACNKAGVWSPIERKDVSFSP